MFMFCSNQKFKNRSECVLQSEEKFWNAITVDFMSEESDKSDDTGVIVVHRLPWRSNGSYICVAKMSDHDLFLCRF